MWEGIASGLSSSLNQWLLSSTDWFFILFWYLISWRPFLSFLCLGCIAILFTIIRTVEPSFHESPPALISTEENLEGLILARDRDWENINMNPPDLANSQKVSPLVDRAGSPLHSAVSGLNPPEHWNVKVRKGERIQNLLEGHLAQSPPCQGKCQGCCPHPREVWRFYVVFCCMLGELSVFPVKTCK